MKIIGLDVGTVRIGVARADTATKIAIPDGYINVNGQEVSEIQRRLRFYNSSVLVIGMPRSNDGVQTAQSEYVKKFAMQVAAIIPGIKIYFQDESLTSVEAENVLGLASLIFRKVKSILKPLRLSYKTSLSVCRLLLIISSPFRPLILRI